MDLEVWLLLGSIGAITLLAGFVHSAIGFGFGIVAISLLPFVVDARSAHVVVSVSSVPMLVTAAWAYREGFEWSSIKQAILGAAIFLPPGLFLFEIVTLDWLVRGTGLAILTVVLLNLRQPASKERPIEAPRTACFVAGAAAGFLGGAVSIAAPPIAAFALKQDWSQARFKAFVTQCLLIISIYKAGILVFRGYVDSYILTLIVVSALLSIAGVQLGLIVSRRIPTARFRRLVAVTLIIVSCLMIWQGQKEAKADGAAAQAAEAPSRQEKDAATN